MDKKCICGFFKRSKCLVPYLCITCSEMDKFKQYDLNPNLFKNPKCSICKKSTFKTLNYYIKRDCLNEMTDGSKKTKYKVSSIKDVKTCSYPKCSKNTSKNLKTHDICHNCYSSHFKDADLSADSYILKKDYKCDNCGFPTHLKLKMHKECINHIKPQQSGGKKQSRKQSKKQSKKQSRKQSRKKSGKKSRT